MIFNAVLPTIESGNVEGIANSTLFVIVRIEQVLRASPWWLIVAVAMTVAIGIPVGILMARHDAVQATLRPVLDLMQTMPSFVYLIPAVMLFGLGKFSALLATVICAVPPLIRLTDLGIRHVDPEILEASTAYGATANQKLFGVQLPLALPSIMAGINQSIMMALAMVVIASMIGARGLGEEILYGLQRLDPGTGAGKRWPRRSAPSKARAPARCPRNASI